MDLDRSFICRLLKENSPSILNDLCIDDDMFTGEFRIAVETIRELFVKYGKMPDLVTVEDEVSLRQAKQYEEPKEVILDYICPEPIAYYADLVKRRSRENIIRSALGEIIADVNSLDASKALSKMEDVLSKAKDKFKGNPDVGLLDIRKTTLAREAAYQKEKETQGAIDGLPFPWRSMNEVTRGIHAGELWFVAARMKMGKTWVLTALADTLVRANKKVLLVSMEMPISKITRRLDAAYAKLPYGNFRSGRLTTEQELQFMSAMADWRKPDCPAFYIAGKGRVHCPQDIEMLIGELKPDIVLIDGFYLMKMGGGKGGGDSKWEKVSTITDDLQDLAQRLLVPIVATTQFNRKVKRETLDAGSEALGFALEIAQNCDGLIGLYQTETMRDAKKMLVRLLEHREGEPLDLNVVWDFTTMDFSEIGPVDMESVRNEGKGKEEKDISY